MNGFTVVFRGGERYSRPGTPEIVLRQLEWLVPEFWSAPVVYRFFRDGEDAEADAWRPEGDFRAARVVKVAPCPDGTLRLLAVDYRPGANGSYEDLGIWEAV